MSPGEVRPPVGGRRHRRRRAVQFATLALLLLAPASGLCRIDLSEKALILLGVAFHTDELGAVYLMLLASMFAVISISVIFGRVWCGWACPQTVLSEAAAMIERALGRVVPRGAGRKFLSGLASALVAVVVSACLVSAFVGSRSLLSPSPGAALGWVLLSAFLTADMLWVRHSFCDGLCPYGILQFILQDDRTLRLRYEPKVGCIGCGLCSRACFMGISLPEGLPDYRCFCCGDCADAAERLPSYGGRSPFSFRFGRPSPGWPHWLSRIGILDVKRVLLVAATAALTALLAYQLTTRPRLTVKITPLYEQATTDGGDELMRRYRLTVGNRSGEDVSVRLEVREPREVALDAPLTLRVPARAMSRMTLVLKARRDGLGSGTHTVLVRSVVEGAAGEAETRTIFLVPEP